MTREHLISALLSRYLLWSELEKRQTKYGYYGDNWTTSMVQCIYWWMLYMFGQNIYSVCIANRQNRKWLYKLSDCYHNQQAICLSESVFRLPHHLTYNADIRCSVDSYSSLQFLQKFSDPDIYFIGNILLYIFGN